MASRKITFLVRTLALGLLALTFPLRAAEAVDPLEAGKAAMDRGDWDAAIGSYDTAIKSDPKDPAAYFYRAQAYGAKGDVPKAISDLSVSIQLNPGNANAYLTRGGAYAMLGKFDEALADANSALALNRDYAAAYCFRGGIYQQRGDFDHALEDCDVALRIDPQFLGAYIVRSETHQSRGENDLAISDLNAALRMSPEAPEVLNNLAWLLATSPQDDLRNGARAFQYASKACDLTHWKNAGYIDTLAAAYAEIGDFEEALKSQQRAVAMVAKGDHAEELQAHLELYQAKKPYREPLKPRAKEPARPEQRM